MGTLVAVAAIAGLSAIVVAAAWAGYRLWRAVMREQRPVLMHRVLEREGVSLGSTTDAMDLARGAAAIRRCAACRDHETCLAWLEGDRTDAFERFCPNAELIAGLIAEARTEARAAGGPSS
jgi:hypothetical protein